MSTRWWIRRSDRTEGPFSSAEIRQLAATALIDPATELSPDRIHWAPARRVGGLRLPTSDSEPAPPAGADATNSRIGVPASERPAFGVAIGCSVIAIGLLILFGIMTVAAPAPQSGVAEQAMVDEVTQQYEATWNYWYSVRTIIAAAPSSADNVQQGAQVFESVAAKIEALPTLQVDVEAVECAQAFARILREAAQHAVASNSPVVVIESFMRGFGGDPFGVPIREMEREKQIQEQGRRAYELCVHTRASLTARYGVEFPSLFTDDK